MTRGIGESAIVEALPDAVVVAGAAVTTLGDTAFVFVLLLAAYWFLPARAATEPRRAAATLIATVTGALAVLTLLKVGFGLPRPPAAAAPATAPDWLPALLEPWFADATAADGFGFPSGHATGGAVTYLGLAAVLDRLGAPRRRLALGATGAAAVALSRVVIEVHYVVDIVAGAVLGTTLLVGGVALARGRLDGVVRLGGLDGTIRDRIARERRRLDPTRPFVAAAVVALLGVAVAVEARDPGSVVDASAALGTALGGAAGWRLCDGTEPPVWAPVGLTAAAVAGPLWVLALADVVHPVVGALLAFVATAIILATPRLSVRVDHRREASSSYSDSP
ncbi:phosphatase PAP2 family protein [Halopenitus persicus]|uniref:Membrane-associated phospholipid phosphatase n=1 Tax=Halopenitus persicus TaxID=1048396 RepID=A0A1H3KNM2_9EURY|nr:phosphatase PAP2 family protein [Halopenitus persicus]SDY53184.1 Membrane-associated phospholipid phosphatase [Halopenitus persicus]